MSQFFLYMTNSLPLSIRAESGSPYCGLLGKLHMFIFYGPYCGLYWARCDIAIHGCKDLMYSQIDGFSEAKQGTEYTTVLFMLLVY